MRQLATDLDGVLLPFIHNQKMGALRVEFKYIPKRFIPFDVREINTGVTFVVLEPIEPAGIHPVFVYGLDRKRAEYIVLDSIEDRRDSKSREINGVR